MDGIKFERAQIHFLATFSLPPSSSLLKVPIIQYFREFRTFFFVLNIANLRFSAIPGLCIISFFYRITRNRTIAR